VPPSVAASAPPTAIVVVFIVVAQEGVRLGRKAYLVTAAPPGERPLYVALANTIIGVGIIGPPSARRGRPDRPGSGSRWRRARPLVARVLATRRTTEPEDMAGRAPGPPDTTAATAPNIASIRRGRSHRGRVA
jgi:hypothetical protein